MDNFWKREVPFVSGVARDVEDPETHLSAYQRSHLFALSDAKNAEERGDLRKRNDLLVRALGDGSDYTAFQDFAGISSLNLRFGDEDDGSQYHSIYDDFYWYTAFIDKDFASALLARELGADMVDCILAGAHAPAEYSFGAALRESCHRDVWERSHAREVSIDGVRCPGGRSEACARGDAIGGHAQRTSSNR